MKFKFDFYLDKRIPLKNGEYSIKVNLYHLATKKNTHFKIKKVWLGMEAHFLRCKSKKEFDDIWTNRHTTNNFGDVTGYTKVLGRKFILRNILLEKQDILDEIIKRPDVTNPKDVIEAFHNYIPNINSFVDDIYKGIENYRDKLIDEGRGKYAHSFTSTLNNIKNFNNDSPFKYGDLTIDWLKSYNRKRQNEVGIASIRNDLTNLRTIYNLVKDDNPTLKEKYPFGVKKFVIPEADTKNVSLNKDDIAKLYKFKSDNQLLQLARDYWIFSYFGKGLNLIDVALLKKSDLKDGILYYYRHKTKNTSNRPIKLKLKFNDIMNDIVKRNKGKGKYLFDIVDDFDDSNLVSKKVSLKLYSIGRQLKKLAQILELPSGFSYQWARHSVATNLVRSNIDFKTIQETYGHSKIGTTMRYIDSLVDENENKIDDALSLD